MNTRHWAALDGMRAVAVVAVMLFHLDPTHRPQADPLRPAGGFLGVDVFFVISGFLITSLLIGEWDRHGRVRLRAFYARRALRLFPALAAAIVVALIGVEVLSGSRVDHSLIHPTVAGLPWVVFYVGNWHAALNNTGDPLGILLHTWSLAVEEQFYVVLPAALILLVRRTRRRTRLGTGILALAGADMVYRILLAHEGYALNRVYYGSDTHADGLLLGCGLAVLLSVDTVRARLATPEAGRIIRAAAAVGCVTLVVLMLRVDQITTLAMPLAIGIAALASAAILLSVVLAPLAGLQPFLESRAAVWIGRRSYGLYLYSFVIDQLILAHRIGSLGTTSLDVIAFAAGFVVAAASYRFLERPCLDLRHRFQRSEALPATLEQPPAPASPSAAI